MIFLEIFFLLFVALVVVYLTTLSGSWSRWRQCFDDSELRQKVEGSSCGLI